MITVIAHYRAKPEGVPAALAALHDLAATVRRLEPECSGITVLQSSDDPTRITCIERWPSREHYQGPHLHQPHVQAFVWGAGAFLAGPPEVSFWRAGDVQDHADPPMIDPPTVVSAPVASRASTAILRAIHANITTLDVDAVVSAANETLLGGGGVDGAIHRAAGPQLLAECRGLNGCRPGEAKITKGYRLRARFVIHTVGPIWQGGDEGEARILASCYRRSIEVAADNGVRTLAFPCVSTGVYGYPPAEAAAIAVATVREALKANPSITEVVFCCFSADDLAHYQTLLGGASANGATPAR